MKLIISNKRAEQIRSQALIREERLKQRHMLNEFCESLKYNIMIYHAHNYGYDEIRNYCKRKKIKCAYGTTFPIVQSIEHNAPMFVFELNNEINKIVGVGLLKNHYHVGEIMHIQRPNYNRYIYIGNQRIDRSEMNSAQNKIFETLDELCFQGRTHLKRGNGVIRFPLDRLYLINQVFNITDFLVSLFHRNNKRP